MKGRAHDPKHSTSSVKHGGGIVTACVRIKYIKKTKQLVHWCFLTAARILKYIEMYFLLRFR